MGYIKEFDFLRALSVFMVMIAHYLSQYHFLSVFSSAGVTMFFVVSGFLITQILLHEKEKFSVQGLSETQKILAILKVFYIRRALRIFPLYYLVLFVLLILNIDSARQFFGYHFFYLSNILYSFHIDFDRLSHFWSLAVEEQFYLIWPILLLIIPRQWITVGFFFFLILISVIFKFVMLYKYGTNSNASNFLMPSCIECFATGAITLLVSQKKIDKSTLEMIMGSSLLLFVMLTIFRYQNFPDSFLFLYQGIIRTIFSFFCGAVLLYIVKGYHGGFISKVLNNSFMLTMGKISYGIYVYHMFVPAIMFQTMDKLGIDKSGSGKSLFLAMVFTVAIAYVSFFLFEKPINNLKRRFSY